MAHSRLEKIGTIFSRVSNLIRTGAMNINDRPLWYDVYRSFPPSVPPKFDRPVPNIKIKPIFYNEDVIRARFHKDMGRSLPATNLRDTNFQTLTQKLIELCLKIQKEKNLDLDEAYQEAFQVIKTEAITYGPTETQSSDIASSFKAALDKKATSEQPLRIQVKDILQDK
ncbi:28S ribosomal protein S23, mitochondrial [Macrosteles quadrilineatus]|uniref:28S ribosomal protein S23, mitochondrial n=1 Tax=Macrosteles quadrilineatus TaxID=74068 RepID=UPI0023E2EB67|nr:28S ribosomal protein S23, mitochondrial [Macrosteles quadrilineatus]